MYGHEARESQKGISGNEDFLHRWRLAHYASAPRRSYTTPLTVPLRHGSSFPVEMLIRHPVRLLGRHPEQQSVSDDGRNQRDALAVSEDLVNRANLILSPYLHPASGRVIQGFRWWILTCSVSPLGSARTILL